MEYCIKHKGKTYCYDIGKRKVLVYSIKEKQIADCPKQVINDLIPLVRGFKTKTEPLDQDEIDQLLSAVNAKEINERLLSTVVNERL